MSMVTIKIDHPGALHKDLGKKAGTKIPLKDLLKARKSADPKERKRAVFAINARSWHKPHKEKKG